ncbi:MAG: isoprenylcysteine carboxylmethyltransferase family protein [Rhodospirillales bacterium]|nr:isoprenylcysteine carboxylmethyltransferase family protein [Rhodospirillales bacterium]
MQDGKKSGNKPEIPAGASRLVPPAWMGLAIIAMGIIWYVVPGRQIIVPPYSYIGGVIFVVGLALAIYGKRQFDHAGTPVRPFTKTTAVVDTGPFRFSRNPMYLAMVIGLIGVAVLFGKVAPFVMVPLFILWIRAKFINHEEQLMEARFGHTYLDYKARVRRWL